MSQKIVEQQFHYTMKMTPNKYFLNAIYANRNAKLEKFIVCDKQQSSLHSLIWPLWACLGIHGVLTLLTPPPPTSRLYPPLGLTSPPPHTHTVAQSTSPPGDASPWLLKRSELSGCWQMNRYYNCNKYFVNKHTTLSLYQKSFINNSIVK